MNKYIIKHNATIIEALNALNKLSAFGLTLFVADDDAKIVGTLTDGDIRRFLIGGGTLSDAVSLAMLKNFSFLFTNDSNKTKKFKSFKDRLIKVIPVLDADMRLVDVVHTGDLLSILPFDAVLMAGGKGERLRPLTEKTPKPLIKVGNKCIIDYNIDRLIQYGVKHINVTVNYLKEQLHEHFSQPRNGVKVHTVEEPKFLGTIGSIKFVENFYNDTVLVMNSDLFTNIDFEDFYLHFEESGADMSVAAVPYNVSIPFGILDLDGDHVKGLLEKPNYNYYANGGIYLIKKSALELIPADSFFNATDLIEKLISLNRNVIRYPLNGTWIDIGQKADLAKAQDLVKHLK